MKSPEKNFKREDILDLNLRLNPQDRLCPSYDCTGITYQKVAAQDVMGMRVVDNCCEDHMM